MFNFEGRKILVTGAASTLGSAICGYLADLDAELILMGTNSEKLSQFRSTLSNNERHRTIAYDFNDCSELGDVLSEGITTPVSGFVHCAGICPLMPLRFFSQESFESTLSINVTSAFLIMQYLRKPAIRPEHGLSAVMISSVTGSVGKPAISGYCASKGALEAATRSWALELASEKIRVNCVASGYVESKMLAEHKRLMSEEKYNEIVRSHPLGLGKPEDIAYATTFLLSPFSRWVTGTTMSVDGGYTAQ